MGQELRDFIMRGSVVDLAVGVVVGVAFAGVINSFVANLLTPLVTIPGEVDFSDLSFTLGGGTFFYGRFLNDLIGFVLIATAVFLVVVRPMNRLRASRARAGDSATVQCAECLSTIPEAARRCAFCAAVQDPGRVTAELGDR